jgi:hypothetical protein
MLLPNKLNSRLICRLNSSLSSVLLNASKRLRTRGGGRARQRWRQWQLVGGGYSGSLAVVAVAAAWRWWQWQQLGSGGSTADSSTAVAEHGGGGSRGSLSAVAMAAARQGRWQHGGYGCCVMAGRRRWAARQQDSSGSMVAVLRWWQWRR